MDVVSDFVTNSWVHVTSNHIGASTRPLRSALHRNEVSIHEPCIFVVVVDTIKQVEGLLADKSVVAVNVHDNFAGLAEVTGGCVPVTKGPHPLSIPDNPESVVDPGIVGYFLKHDFGGVVVGIIVNHVYTVVGVVLLVDGLQKHLVGSIGAVLHQIAERGHHANALLRSVAIQVVFLVQTVVLGLEDETVVIEPVHIQFCVELEGSSEIVHESLEGVRCVHIQ